MIAEALSTKNETLEERVIRLMPENVKPIWEKLSESGKKSILSQARLYPTEVLTTESQVEHFWNTRNLKKNESVTKKLVSHESLIQEDKLSDNDVFDLLRSVRDKQKIAQILNQYHNKKTPEIQKEIDKYLHAV